MARPAKKPAQFTPDISAASPLETLQRSEVVGLPAAELRSVAGEAAASLRRKPNVAYVTIGEKRVGGARNGKRALIVYVRKKEVVAPKHRIPKRKKVLLSSGKSTLLPTDVVELDNVPRAFGLRSGHVVRAEDGDLGICGLSFLHNGLPYAITNAHVVSNVARHVTFEDPEVQDRADLQFYQIGKTVYATDFPQGRATDEDVAIIRANMIQIEPMLVLDENRPISDFAGFERDENAVFWYSVNGGKQYCMRPEPFPLDESVPILVDGITLPYRNFWKLQVVRGLAKPGHSGALICREANGVIVGCGLLFGGVEPNYVYAFAFDEVMARVRRRLG